MAVSPSDFALYSRVTGRAIPSDRGARMKMAPEVNRFIRNREYERPQKTALQKGADLLGKAAMIGGTLAAAHAIGGGFKGQTAEKVADVVENMTKTGDVGEKGGNELINRVLNRTGRDLDSLDDVSGDIPPSGGNKPPSGGGTPPSTGEKQLNKGHPYFFDSDTAPTSDYYEADDIYEDNQPTQAVAAAAAAPTNPPNGGMSRMEKLMRREEARADAYDSVWGQPLDNAFETAIALDDERDARGLAGNSALAPVNEGGLRQRVENFGNKAEQHVKDWWHLDNEKIGYQIQGALENENPLAGAAQVTGVIGPALVKQGLLNAGQTAQGLYGYGKEFMGDYIDTVKQGYKRAQDIALSDQIRSSSMGVGGGKVLGGDFSVSGSPLLYGMQNQIDQGWSRHDAAIAPLAKNLQALLPTTRFTGQVSIGEDHQLNHSPDRPPGETDMAPSRLIQQFSDRRISGEGSLTPGDRSDLSALLSGSRGQYGPIEGLKALGPDETVSGDMEIHTDVGVNDPVNFTQLFGKRVGKGEKDKFITGLKERNKDIYSNASDLPARKVGGKGKMGTSGLAGSMAGVSDWEDRDSKDPLHGIKQYAAGFMEKPDLSDKAAEDVGRRMAEREEQGNLFKDDDDDPWKS